MPYHVRFSPGNIDVAVGFEGKGFEGKRSARMVANFAEQKIEQGENAMHEIRYMGSGLCAAALTMAATCVSAKATLRRAGSFRHCKPRLSLRQKPGRTGI